MAVAQMVCEDTPVSYFDYENTTTPRMADTMDCTVDKRAVCEPVTTKKCAEVTYTKCEEVSLEISLREAFQSKKQQNLGISPNRGAGSSKNQKSPKFQLGKVQN